MRFLADENVWAIATAKLRASGHEVISVAETRPGMVDTDVLALACSSGSVLITEDQDFGELIIRHRLPVPGIILLEMDQLSNAAEAQRLSDVVTQVGGELLGNIIVIEPTRTRIRPLRAPE